MGGDRCGDGEGEEGDTGGSMGNGVEGHMRRDETEVRRYELAIKGGIKRRGRR